MKKLELKKMETIKGGDLCAAEMGLAFIAGSLLFGLLGGFANAYYTTRTAPSCNPPAAEQQAYLGEEHILP